MGRVLPGNGVHGVVAPVPVAEISRGRAGQPQFVRYSALYAVPTLPAQSTHVSIASR